MQSKCWRLFISRFGILISDFTVSVLNRYKNFHPNNVLYLICILFESVRQKKKYPDYTVESFLNFPFSKYSVVKL